MRHRRRFDTVGESRGLSNVSETFLPGCGGGRRGGCRHPQGYLMKGIVCSAQAPVNRSGSYCSLNLTSSADSRFLVLSTCVLKPQQIPWGLSFCRNSETALSLGAAHTAGSCAFTFRIITGIQITPCPFPDSVDINLKLICLSDDTRKNVG